MELRFVGDILTLPVGTSLTCYSCSGSYLSTVKPGREAFTTTKITRTSYYVSGLGYHGRVSRKNINE